MNICKHLGLFGYICFFGAVSAVSVAFSDPVVFTIDPEAIHQTIENFGSSSGWDLGTRLKDWPEDVLEDMATWVFSTDLKSDGSPEGIGLSGFRIQIGAGSAYQGDASEIVNVTRRTECYLQPDGSYDWQASAGETYWLRKAREYRVRILTGYANSPPFIWTKNGLTHKTVKSLDSNLRDDRYADYAHFLATVAEHFQQEGTGFDLISPLNEPQYSWTGTQQEGSPWSNEQIARMVRAFDEALAQYDVSTRILMPESGAHGYLYEQKSGFSSAASDQIRAFWQPGQSTYIGNLARILPAVAGHSYWTNSSNNSLVNHRVKLHQRLGEIAPELAYWQTEYSLLGNDDNPTSIIDGVLHLAKIIHFDLVEGQAASWNFWSTFEYGRAIPRFTLVAAKSPTNTNPVKLMWTLGHYSRFVRPGMVRVGVDRSDDLTSVQSASDLMVSAFIHPTRNKLTVVVINADDQDRTLRFEGPARDGVRVSYPLPGSLIPFLTTAGTRNLKRQPSVAFGDVVTVPAQSLMTLTSDTDVDVPDGPVANSSTGRGYQSIQQAINSAQPGDIISVSPGIYYEALDFQGKPITVTSVAPLNHDVVARTVIRHLDTVVTFGQGEPVTTQLRGVTLTGGKHGIHCMGSYPQISHCRIVGHRAAGITLDKTSGPLFRNCLIAGNRGPGILVPATAGKGRGRVQQFATVQHCTIVDNQGAGLSDFQGNVTNTILYYNGTQAQSSQVDGTGATLSYCDVQGTMTGTGNIDTPPEFISRGHWEGDIWRGGDYHLSSDSPCINAGDPAFDGNDDTDIDDDPRIQNGRTDIGWDEVLTTGVRSR